MFKRKKTLFFKKQLEYTTNGNCRITKDIYYFSYIQKSAIKANVEILDIKLVDFGTCYVKIKYKQKSEYNTFCTYLMEAIGEDIKSIVF